MIAWGSAYKTRLQNLQQQNTILRLMFFATTFGPYTESALPLLNLRLCGIKLRALTKGV